MQVIDLSVLINEDTPVYPGDPKTKIEPAGVLANDGYNDHYVSMGTHVGTHVDAPLHMIESGKSLDQIPIEACIGPGRYIRVRDEFDLEAIKAVGVQPGDIVLFHTGMSDQYNNPSYFESYPAMSEGVAEYLIEQKVKMIGLDTCSADNIEGFPIHKLLLSSGVLIIENLTNLAALAESAFTVYALPLKLAIDGSPARVVAVIE